MRISLIVGIVFWSCNLRDNTHLKTIEIFRNTDTTLSISHIANAADYIILRADPGFKIGEITKIKLHKNRFYILDEDVASSFFCFTKAGKPQFSIKFSDNTPNTPISVSDFSCHDSLIYLLDNSQRKIFVYTEKGAFVRLIRTPADVDNIEVTKTAILLYKNRPFKKGKNQINAFLLQLDFNGKLVNTFLPVSPENNYMSFHDSPVPLVCTDEKNVYISRLYDEIIYRFDGLNVEAIQSFDFGNSRSLASFSNENANAFLNKLQQEASCYVMAGYFESDNFLYFQCVVKGQLMQFLKNNHTGKQYLFNTFESPENSLPFLKIDFVSDTVIGFCTPPSLLNSFVKNKSEKNLQNTPISELFEKIDLNNCNPVIIMANINKMTTN